MPSRGTYSYAKGAVVFLSVVLMQTMCEAKNNLENIAETYKGDGVASYLKRPGILGANGVCLEFETFALSAGFDRELLISGLPTLKQEYVLYFSPDKEFDKKIEGDISIQTILKDDGGTIVWNINNRLSEWIKSTWGPAGVGYYYMVFNDSKSQECAFIPRPNMNYKLSIRFRVEGAPEKMVGRAARFYLRAGGGK